MKPETDPTTEARKALVATLRSAQSPWMHQAANEIEALAADLAALRIEHEAVRGLLTHTRKDRDEVRLERDELRAALLNERGEGEPPSEGWAPDDVTPGRWEHRARGWCCYRIKSREYIVVERGSLSGELAREMTAREAMKAADTALAGGKS